MDRRRVAFLFRFDVANGTRIQAERRDDLLAVLQLELLLDWLAVAGRCRYIDQPAGIGDAEVREEHARRPGAPGERRQHRIAFPQPRRREILHFLLALHPAVPRDDHDVVFFDDEVIGGVFGFIAVAFDAGAALVAVLRADFLELAAHELPAAVLVLQQRVDLARALPLVLELLPDDENLEPGEAVDLQLEDGVDLFGVELEPRDDLFRRIGLAVRLADDLDDLVERVEDRFEAFEDVDAPLERRKLVFEPAGDHLEPEVQEVPQNLLEIEALRPAHLGVFSRHQTRQVDREVGLQGRVLEEVRHHHLLVGVLLHFDRDAHVLGRQVLDVQQRRQLAAEHDVGDLLDQLRLVDRVGNAVDVDRLGRSGFRSDVPCAAQADAAGTGPVDQLQLVWRVEDLPAGREVGTFDVLVQLRVADVLVVQQLDERRADFTQVVRRNIRRHADGDAGRAVDQQVRNPRRQHDRFELRAVVVRPEVDGRLLDFGQHFIADAREPAFGVSHRGGAVAVEGSEVSGAVHERVAQRKRLRHAHERFVQGRVSVRMVAAHHVTDDFRALPVLGVGREVLLPHRVEDAALDRLQPVANVGQRARGDDRERVVQVARLRRLVQRDLIDAAAVAAAEQRRSNRRVLAGWLCVGGVQVVEEGLVGWLSSASPQRGYCTAPGSWALGFRLRTAGIAPAA